MFGLLRGGQGASILENLGERSCPACGRAAPFTAKLLYGWAGVGGLCAWVTRREYVAECAGCDARLPLDTKEARNYWPKDGIPFGRKWSRLLFLIVLTMSAAGAGCWGTMWSSGTAGYLSSPKRHDLYIVNLAAIPDSGFDTGNSGESRDHAYGVMKLIAMDKDEMIFATSTTAFTSPSGVIDMLERSPHQLNFDTQNLLSFDKKDVRHLWEQKIIQEIRR